MLTWTTYGSWLPGDERGYVDDGVIKSSRPKLQTDNRGKQTYPTANLNLVEQEIVHKAIQEEAEELNQRILALSVNRNHIHVVAEHNEIPIEKAVSHYKNAARMALRKNGFNGRIWTQGFDKRYCFHEKELEQKIRYVLNHKNG